MPSLTLRSDASRAEKEQFFIAEAERQRREGQSLLEWSAKFRTEDGRPLDFDAYPYQRELYATFGDREVPSVDVMKSAQCGISAAAVSLALYAPDVWQANVLYVLPTSDDAYDFSDTRVKPSIEDSAYLSFVVASTDNKGLKRIGRSNVYFRGSGSERKALSIPADVLILDEYDRLDQRQVPKFQRRLNAATSLKLQRRFSNPSFPESGIHALYLESDQREWLVACAGCKAEAPITYAGGEGSHRVDEGRRVRVCARCGRTLRPEQIGAGRWVPRHPGLGAVGFHISRLIVPADDMGAIIDAHGQTAEDEIAAHYNFDLGLPYAPKGGSLDADQVNACRREWDCPTSYQGRQWVTAGVDVGSVLHVRISVHTDQGAVPLYIGEVHEFEELAHLWDTYNVNFGLIDERPEERAARAFAARFPGRAYLIRWSGDEQRDNVVVDSDKRLVIARRTWSCDKSVAAFAGQTRLLPREVPPRYVTQITAPHRVVETTKAGQKVARYVSERADHYFFAETHDLLAKEARGGAPIDVGVGPATVREEVAKRRKGRR